MSAVTQLINLWNQNDEEALDRLIALAYERLHISAKRALGYYGHSDSIQATELVNELYLSFRKQGGTRCRDSQHFFAIAALKLRQILNARHEKKRALKRDHGKRESATAIEDNADRSSLIESLVLNDTLDLIEQIDPLCTRVSELKVFWEFDNGEIAAILAVSESTVYRKWQAAKASIMKNLREQGYAPGP